MIVYSFPLSLLSSAHIGIGFILVALGLLSIIELGLLLCFLKDVHDCSFFQFR